MIQPAERRPIPGHRQYAADENGNIYRMEGGTNPGVAVKQQRHKVRNTTDPDNYYLYYSMRTCDGFDINGNAIDRVYNNVPRGVHRLVCAAFHGPPPEGKPWVNHKNGVKHDNRAVNYMKER